MCFSTAAGSRPVQPAMMTSSMATSVRRVTAPLDKVRERIRRGTGIPGVAGDAREDAERSYLRRVRLATGLRATAAAIDPRARVGHVCGAIGEDPMRTLAQSAHELEAGASRLGAARSRRHG